MKSRLFTRKHTSLEVFEPTLGMFSGHIEPKHTQSPEKSMFWTISGIFHPVSKIDGMNEVRRTEQGKRTKVIFVSRYDF